MTADDPLVLVTGATGFVASQLVRELLQQGYRVRGTVRDPAKADVLWKLPRAAERLELATADLLAPGSFDAAMADVTLVAHTASPYTLTVADAQRDLVEPAEQGTLNVLAAAKNAGVRRVVLTSSVAAISDEPDPKVKLTEKHWNTKSSLTRNPYYFSKVRGERAAWEFMEREKPRFSLIAVNPFLVLGPSLIPGLNSSNAVIANILNGKYPGIIDLTWGIVDVRDVALAHLLALTTPRARGRYLCAAGVMSMREVVGKLSARGYGERFPKLGKTAKRGLDHALGNVVVKLGSWFQPRGVGSYLRTHLGRRPRFDNSKIKSELGLTFRGLEQTLVDTVEDLIRWGHVVEAGSLAPSRRPA